MEPSVLAAIIASSGQVVNTGGGLVGAKKQRAHNFELARYQHQRNVELLSQQLEYDTPKKQMERYQDAGLNPNLVYGQGSAGNQSSPLSFPEIKTANFQAPYGAIGTGVSDLVLKYQQAKLMESQRDLTDNKVIESTVKRDLMAAQKDLVKANPYMRSEYVDSMVRQLKSAADIKEQEGAFKLETVGGQIGQNHYTQPVQRGMAIMQQEFDTLMQKFNLYTLDQKMKAELIQGKGFQNALQNIQLKWMKDAEITPQHIYLFIQMLLSKMM